MMSRARWGGLRLLLTRFCSKTLAGLRSCQWLPRWGERRLLLDLPFAASLLNWDVVDAMRI